MPDPTAQNPPAGPCAELVPIDGPAEQDPAELYDFCDRQRPCPVHDAGQPHTAPQPPADGGPHPATLILGRALVYREATGGVFLHEGGDQWVRYGAHHARAEIERAYPGTFEVLLVSPAAAHVIQAAVRARAAERDADEPNGWGRWQDAVEALAAAVDALTGGPEQALQDLPRREAETSTEPAVIRIADGVHWLGEVASDTEPDPDPAGDGPRPRRTRGPDHDGLTGRPLEPLDVTDAERAAWLAEVEHREPPHVHTCACMAEHHTHECGCGHEWWADRWYEGDEACGAECTEPPAGDGPGWDREHIDAMIEGAGTAPDDADQLRALLADRDRQENNWKSEAQRMLSVAEERDAARAELAEVRDQAAKARDLDAEVVQLRAELAEVENRWQRAMADGDDQTVTRLRLHAEIRQLRAERDKALRIVALRDSELAEMTNARDEVRALLAEVTAELDQARVGRREAIELGNQTIEQQHHELERLRAEVDQAWTAAGDMAAIEEGAATARTQLAEVTADRDRLHNLSLQLFSDLQAAKAQLVAARSELDQIGATNDA